MEPLIFWTKPPGESDTAFLWRPQSGHLLVTFADGHEPERHAKSATRLLITQARERYIEVHTGESGIEQTVSYLLNLAEQRYRRAAALDLDHSDEPPILLFCEKLDDFAGTMSFDKLMLLARSAGIHVVALAPEGGLYGAVGNQFVNRVDYGKDATTFMPESHEMSA